MSSTAELTVEKSTRKEEILKLISAANGAKNVAIQRARSAVEAAAQAGKLLREEKAWVEEKFGRGLWHAYFEEHYGARIPLRTAQQWMRLSDSILIDCEPEANVLRQGLLALDIMPAKEHPEVEGDAALRPVISHLSVVNKFTSFATAFRKSGRTFSEEEREQLRTDFKPLIEFLRENELI